MKEETPQHHEHHGHKHHKHHKHHRHHNHHKPKHHQVPKDGGLNTISVEDAIRRTTIWRQFIAEHLNRDEKEIPRGCLIPLADIKRLSESLQYEELKGVRAYFTVGQYDSIKDVKEISLIFVPVDKDDRDILEFTFDEDLSESAVEDFTKPCPQACDKTSPLYNDPNGQ
ncbi:hypothetical protein LX64_03118 [Chitinophaga skermanii]|uniref:Uncharacterized protein n=1 Tax=Chitinophaga skermanii TaxID=331697 RepID=A0A327QJQ5_9BACT|nr:hypothetical protein [Chitinophaga skermanii]RAJ04238.1 hypothetical protein LX64_03118 [Chitinophaga skermanii]